MTFDVKYRPLSLSSTYLFNCQCLGSQKSGTSDLGRQRAVGVGQNPVQLPRQNCPERLRTLVEALPQDGEQGRNILINKRHMECLVKICTLAVIS